MCREKGEVKSMCGGFGFISPITNSQKTYFFRARDVDGKSQLQAGDTVDFFLAPDPKRPMEMIAVGVRLLGSSDALSNIAMDGTLSIELSLSPLSFLWLLSLLQLVQFCSLCQSIQKYLLYF